LVYIYTNVQLRLNFIFIILVISFNFEIQIIYMWSLKLFKVGEILCVNTFDTICSSKFASNFVDRNLPTPTTWFGNKSTIWIGMNTIEFENLSNVLARFCCSHSRNDNLQVFCDSSTSYDLPISLNLELGFVCS
jgi:hypothetical protein